MKVSVRTIATIAAGILASQFAQGHTQSATGSPDVISENAAIYATYHADVSDVRSKSLASADDIEESLTNLGGQNVDQLSSGWIAYSALVASQNPQFRSAVRDIEGFYGRDSLMLGLRNDIRYARTLEGGTSAVTSSLSAIEADSRRLKGAGAYVKEQAYSLQGAGWAKAKIASTDALINRMKSTALSGRPVRANLRTAFSAPDIDSVLVRAGQQGAPSLWEGVSTAAGAIRFPTIKAAYSGRAARIRHGKEPIADKIATLAAYRILGDGAAPASELRNAMNERSTSACLKMAQLNLQQCVAAAHKQYEVPFCIGEHALTDVGECIGEVTQ
jgi:hypothetical protein